MRVSAAAGCLQDCAQCEISAGWIRYAVIAVCGCLCAGALTPLVAVTAVVLQLTAGANLCGAGVITIINALALALLGPGAYSLDALRFGRRLILVESWRNRHGG